MNDTASSLPLGIYIHVPWCRRRCPYCDFYFEIGRPDGRFRAALRTELSARIDETGGQTATSLYFGGGTPSLLPAPTIAGIIEDVRQLVGLERQAEVTIEANPEDVHPELVKAWVDAGVGRVSLGTQAFNDEALRFLGRVHTAKQAYRAITECGRDLRVSADVIGGLPGNDVQRCAEDVSRAVDAGSGQVSFYLLTVEEGTPLHRWVNEGKVPPPTDDAQVDAYAAASRTLLQRGLAHVEVSSWARPGEEPRHNRLYWGQGRYLGMGPGAHSMRPDGKHVIRRHTTATLGPWLAHPSEAAYEVECLVPEQAAYEALAFGLRDLLAGVDLDELEMRFDCRLEVEDALHAREAQGHVHRSGRRWWLTEEGALFADGVARDVLHCAPDQAHRTKQDGAGLSG